MSIPAKPIGDINAKCPKCGKTQFESTTGLDSKPNDLLTCSACGHTLRQKDLVAQIGDEATKRANEFLGEIVQGLNKRR